MPVAMKLKKTTNDIPTLVTVDPSQPGETQANIHTRWHPEIPCVATIDVGKPFRVECLDYSGSQVHNDDNADDIVHLDHDSDHHLSGPFFVPGSQPGDVLEIEILDVQPFQHHNWGYCVTAPGLGSLDDHDDPDRETKVTKSIWDFFGNETSSRHVPHVSFQGRPHPGVLGTAPSHELLEEWKKRESELEVATAGAAGCSLPKSRGAYVGQDISDELRQRIYTEGARTSPGREHGGNIDIGLATRGSKMYLPVYIPGASLSVGDLHFCQSDGEPTTAIEMAGIATLRVNVIPQGVRQLCMRSPMFRTSPTEPIYRDKICFTGLSVDRNGKQTDQHGLLAYRNAAFQAIEYLESFGYTREQAYILLSAAPIESRVIATANRPNFVISLGIPTEIFEFDISPRREGISDGEKKRVIQGPAVPSVTVNGKIANGFKHEH
ncbi:uncharacterized protein I303_101948 [Kwoniella dejecticola CBS 10117]|uniref:Formamidase n=1 Tax=Kwoniella dejecticola CBS 10117 TaxID=1296121 RepID=A0A1A6ACB5_9TREE|nr:uncharacterized protein I303_01916 [Kwoniella dejecticola CBS 10117]OBR87707.1 hypothetical protein I303_01916 [Kwoniella dejecticola CBS 10117]